MFMPNKIKKGKDLKANHDCVKKTNQEVSKGFVQNATTSNFFSQLTKPEELYSDNIELCEMFYNDLGLRELTQTAGF